MFQPGQNLDLTYPLGHPKAGQPLDKVCLIGQSATGKTQLMRLMMQMGRQADVLHYDRSPQAGAALMFGQARIDASIQNGNILHPYSMSKARERKNHSKISKARSKTRSIISQPKKFQHLKRSCQASVNLMRKGTRVAGMNCCTL